MCVRHFDLPVTGRYRRRGDTRCGAGSNHDLDAVGFATFRTLQRSLVDLGELTCCDSTGISVLVSACRRAQNENGSLALVGLNDDLTFAFYSTVDEVVGER